MTNSGHPTSSMSAADLMAVLIAKHLRYDFDEPDDPHNDHLIFSKGHASPLLYSMFKAAGAITDEELLTFRKFGSRLEGHPTPASRGSTSPPARSARACRSASASRSPASASTGCRTASGCSAATARWPRARSGRRSSTPRFYELDNLIAIIDVNRLGQRGETMHGWDLDSYAKRARGLRLARDRDRRPRRRGDRRAPTRGRRDRRAADRDRRADDQGQGRQGGRGQARLARQGARRPRGRRSRSSAASRNILVDVAQARRQRRAARVRGRGALELPSYELGDGGRDAQGLRRRAGRARRGRAATSSRSTARSRTRPTPRLPRRRTPSASSRCTSPSSRWSRPPSACRCAAGSPFASTFAAFLVARLRLRPHGRDLPARTSASAARTPASRSARTARRRWRSRTSPMFRAVHGSTVLYPSDANQTAKLVARDGRPRRHLVHAHHPRRDAGDLRRRTRSSRSAAAGRALVGRRRRHDRRRRDHAARGARRRPTRSRARGSRPA